MSAPDRRRPVPGVTARTVAGATAASGSGPRTSRVRHGGSRGRTSRRCRVSTAPRRLQAGRYLGLSRVTSGRSTGGFPRGAGAHGVARGGQQRRCVPGDPGRGRRRGTGRLRRHRRRGGPDADARERGGAVDVVRDPAAGVGGRRAGPGGRDPRGCPASSRTLPSGVTRWLWTPHAERASAGHPAGLPAGEGSRRSISFGGHRRHPPGAAEPGPPHPHAR